jgi:hypothetical protein
MVVERSSAILGYPKEISKSLDADHHTVCKYDSIYDQNYISIRNALKTLVTAIRSKGEILYSLMQCLLANLTRPTHGSISLRPRNR